jgi:hypothetical protein
MSKDLLHRSAHKLQQPSSDSILDFSVHKEEILALINLKALMNRDIMNSVDHNEELMKDNHNNHYKFMESTFTHYDAMVFVDTLLWVFRAYKARAFDTQYFEIILNTWMETYHEILKEKTCTEIEPFYSYMKQHLPILSKLAEIELNNI